MNEAFGYSRKEHVTVVMGKGAEGEQEGKGRDVRIE